MNKTLLALAASLALAIPSHAQTPTFSFSGGNGAPLTITLNESLTYTVSTTSSNTAPLFDFQGLGALLTNPVADSSSTMSFSINNGAPIQINEFASGGGDLFAFNTSFPGITAGETITLNAGSFTTAAAYSGAAPATENIGYTYVGDQTGNQLSTHGVQATPEPSAWALSFVALGAFLAVRRLRQTA